MLTKRTGLNIKNGQSTNGTTREKLERSLNISYILKSFHWENCSIFFMIILFMFDPISLLYLQLLHLHHL